MAAVLGLNAKLYRNTGSWASPSFDLISNVKNLTVKGSTETADVSTRGTGGFKATVATLKDISLEFEMVWDNADADFTALKNAWLNNTTIEMLALDGPSSTTGSQGPRFDGMVTNFERSEQLTEALMVNVTVVPTYSSNTPTWYTVP